MSGALSVLPYECVELSTAHALPKHGFDGPGLSCLLLLAYVACFEARIHVAALLHPCRRSFYHSTQVARRVRSADYIARLADEGRLQRHATRYMPACLAEEVFLHPRSCLASTAPEYVVYMNIVRTAKRPYMALVTSVEPQWLADCGSSLCTGMCVDT